MASTENPLIQDHAAMTLGGRQQPPQHLQQQPQQQQQHARATSLGLTALMSSCQLNNELEVKALLQRKPSLTAARDRSGKTALHYCAENLTTGCAELLLLYEPGLTSVQDEEGYTTLHFAVISGNRTMVRFLVERGADVNCVDNEKHSCVHWATVCGELECMDILVSAGANPSTADIHGAYPIHYAAQMCGPNSEMGNDVRVGLAALRRLIELGVDVSVRDQDGRPPLLWAASVETRPSKTYCPSGSSDAILALVNAGADVAATDKDGLTALHCAASRGHVDCLETLVSLCGADVDAVDSNGCSALFYAVTLGHADCTQLLLKYGAAPNRQDHKGRTPAHCGAAKGQMETLKILWQHGANLYMRNQRGDLPLHEAVQSGRKDLVQWLLELQPSAVNSPNNNGRCALHVAAMANSVEMCKVLMDRGAEVNPVMRNSKGQLLTPLDASLQRGNRGCAKYLRLHGALPFCKMTDRHDIDRWLEHSFSINKLHKTDQLCDSEAPPAVSGLAPEDLQLLDAKHVQTLESSVQTDSGYFESREYRASRQPGDAEEAVTKQGTFIESGRTLKQAIITNVYVRTSGGARVHQPKRKRAGASKGKADGFAEGSEGTEEYSSSGEEKSTGMRESSRQKTGSREQHAELKESKKRHTMLDSSTTHRVVEEVIVKKQDGPEGHVVKRITRRPSGDEGDEVRVTGEMRDNVETTPEGFTSVTFSEQKSSETGRVSSEDDARTRLMTREAAAARTLGDVPERTSRQPLKSPAVIRAAERFLGLLSARRSRKQADQTSRRRLKEPSETLTLSDTRIREESEATESMIDERRKKENKVARFQEKVKQTVKHVRQSPKRRSSSSGRSSSESEPAKATKKDKASRTKGTVRSLSREPSGGQQRRREADEVETRKQKQEKMSRRAGKSGGDSVAAVKGTSDQDQSASSDTSKQRKVKRTDASVPRKHSAKAQPKDSASAKKDSRRSAKGSNGRHSESNEEPSSSAEGSDSAGDDGEKKESKHVMPEARTARETASRDLKGGKELNADERLESATGTKMHREYEEIESHATMAEFFSETSMSDSALEHRSDRVLARHEEGATEETLKEERASRERAIEKPRPPEKDQQARHLAERKSTYEAKGKDRSPKQLREEEKVRGAKKGSSRQRDTDLGDEFDSQASEKAATDAAGQDGGARIEVSEGILSSKIKRHRAKIEERVVQEASSSESLAESTSERIERSDNSFTKRTVLEKKLGTKKAQSKKTEVKTDLESEGKKISEKVISSKKKVRTTPDRSSKERHVEDSGPSEEEIISTEVCEEEIIEKHATELDIVEILETKAPGKATTSKDDVTAKTPSKRDQRQKRKVKHKTTDKHDDTGESGDKAKGKKEANSGDPVVRDDKWDKRGSTDGSISSSVELEAARERFESSQETLSVTKETSNVHLKEEVTSEETLREISKEEIVEHACEITVAEGEPADSTADVAGTEKVEEDASIEQDKTTEKSNVSSAVAEAVIDLHGLVPHRSPSSQEQLASEKQSAPRAEYDREEDADSKESSAAKVQVSTSGEHASELKKPHIPPVVAEAEKVEKDASIEQDKTIEKSKVSSTVAEAVIDLYSRVQRTSPGSQEQHASQKQPERRVEPALSEGADSRESSETKESRQGTSDEHEPQSEKSHIPPVVAEAVSDLYTHVKQLASASTSPNQKITPMRDSATSPVSGPITVETACGPDDIGLVDTACGTRQSSIEVAEKAVSPEEEYTAEAACSPVAEETNSVACSPAMKKVDASCSPSESVDQTMQDATCSPVATDAAKDREKTDTACSPILELSDGVREVKDATCSPVTEGAQAEKADAASSPADFTVDAQSSPLDIAVEQKDSTSSPVIALFRQDELISPMIVEVCDKETWTGPPDDQTADASCTPMFLGVESAAAEKQETATSPVNLQLMRDEECSPIAADAARETRDASCSPPDFGLIAPADERGLTSVAVSPIRATDGALDKATSPQETVSVVSAGVSPFAQAVGVEHASSPQKVYTTDTSSSPFPESTGPFGEGLPTAATTKPVTFDICLGTSPEDEKGVRAEFADAACSPIAFEYSRLSRSSSGSTEVDIAVRSSSLEETTKTPMTDITAIRTLVEAGTSPIGEVRTATASDSAGVQVKPTITDSGTSPLIQLGQTKGTSTEDREAQHALSDSCTSPLERIALSESAATRDAASSPIENADATTAGRKPLKDVILLKKPVPLRKTKSWDTMGYGNLDETRLKELLFPEIRLPSGTDQRMPAAAVLASPVTNGVSLDIRNVDEGRQLQRLPSIVKTASTPPDTAAAAATGQQISARNGETPTGVCESREKKSLSLQPLGAKRHSLTQSDYDRSPESSVRSSDYTANTLKDSGFSDVEKHVSGGSSAEDEDRATDRQGVLSDSAAHELESQRRRLLHSRRMMRDGEDGEASPGRDDDTDGSGPEDGSGLGDAASEKRRSVADRRGSPQKKVKTKAKGRGDSGKEQRRRRGQPELRPVAEVKKVPQDLTMTVQESLRKYRVERQLFSELQELKRHQIRSGRTHENVLVKRLVDRFRELVLAPGMRDFTGPYTFRNYERYLYGQLRDLSTSNDGKVPPKYRKRDDDEADEHHESGTASDGPLECVSRAYGWSQPPADDRSVGTGTSAKEVGGPNDQTEDSGTANMVAATVTEEGDAGNAPSEAAGPQRARHVQPSHPVGRKNLLPAILPSPLTSMFTVVRGAPPLPSAARSTGYGHVRSRVFPQRPAEKVQLTESSVRRSPRRTVRTKKEASTSTTEVASNQASRLRVERIRKQREEEERLRRRREEMASRVTVTEGMSRLHGSVQNLRRISEEESLERAAATDGALSEQEGLPGRKKHRSTSLTREVTGRRERETRAGKTMTRTVKEVPATRGPALERKLDSMGKAHTKGQEPSQATADASRHVFPYLKKHEGRISASRTDESNEPEVSGATRAQQTAALQDRRALSRAAQKTTEVPTEPREFSPAATRAEEPVTPRRPPFSKAKDAVSTTPKRSSALLPFWVPHDPKRTNMAAIDEQEKQQFRSSVRESLGEQQAVRFKDWIKARQQGSSATSAERASVVTADAATEALAREVRLREGDSSETDSGHEGDGILPDDQRVDEVVLLERVSRSLRKNVLPQDVVTMRLKPSPPTAAAVAAADEIEAITRTVRVSEFLEAARRDIVVNCVQLRPDNVSEGSSSPEEVPPSPAASSGDGGSVSDGVDDDEGVLEFEVRHGREKNVFWLPTNKIRDNKKWQVTFIVARTDRE
ncbi:uncharacterized protein LOC142588749 [Dermacentor variabilis]|uniref:uncharacterized protein LOC142588749 n=1 Tax=Dermacentor variabilis TaxID=34621 RepID=UPI003F5B6018